jgi:hypothetical protein
LVANVSLLKKRLKGGAEVEETTVKILLCAAGIDALVKR